MFIFLRKVKSLCQCDADVDFSCSTTVHVQFRTDLHPHIKRVTAQHWCSSYKLHRSWLMTLSLSLVPSLINSSTTARWKLSNWHAGLTPLTIFPLTVPLLSATAPPTFAPVSCGWRTWPSGSPARRTPYGGCTSRSGTGPWWCLQLKMRELKWKSSIQGRRLQLRCRIYFG